MEKMRMHKKMAMSGKAPSMQKYQSGGMAKKMMSEKFSDAERKTMAKKSKTENPMKEERAREGKKAAYRKMGFGKMMDSGEIKFKKKGGMMKPKKAVLGALIAKKMKK